MQLSNQSYDPNQTNASRQHQRISVDDDDEDDDDDGDDDDEKNLEQGVKTKTKKHEQSTLRTRVLDVWSWCSLCW